MARPIAALLGVSNVGVGLSVPLRPNRSDRKYGWRGRRRSPVNKIPVANFRTAKPTFEAAGMRIVGGRNFQSTDHMDARKVVILNEALADRLFGDADPIEKRVTWTGEVLPAIGMKEEWKSVVGIADNTLDNGPDASPPTLMFEPIAQNALGFFPGAFVVSATAAVITVMAAVALACSAPALRAARVDPLIALRTE